MREAAAGMEMCKFHAGGLFELLCALGICSWRVMRGGVGGGSFLPVETHSLSLSVSVRLCPSLSVSVALSFSLFLSPSPSFSLYLRRTYPSVHDAVATVVTQDGISAKGSAELQAEAARVRKEHERAADLETAKMLGGSDEDLHEPTRNEDVGDDAIGAAGTVVGNVFGGGDEMDAPIVEGEQPAPISGSSSRRSGSGVGATEQRFAEETMQFFGLRQHRRRRR